MLLNYIREQLNNLTDMGLLACYVIGSYADGTAVSTSDIDLVIILKQGHHPAIREIIKQRLTEIETAHAIQFDLEICDEQQIDSLNNPSFIQGSSLLMGQDIRASVPLMSIEAWAADRLHTSYWRCVHFFNRSHRVSLPLDYPMTDDVYLGYGVNNSTRQLLRHISWMATALVAYQGKQYVARKADVAVLYRQTVGDGFSDYIEQLYRQCKIEWRYVFPDNPTLLRDLCIQTLVFENHFLQIYRQFVLNELGHGDEKSQSHTLWVLSKLPLIDDEIQETLIALASPLVTQVDDGIRTQAAHVLQAYNLR